MIPVQNHIEQFLNSLDAVNAGLGLRDTEFPSYRHCSTRSSRAANKKFRDWVDSAEGIAVVEKVASDKGRSRAGGKSKNSEVQV